MGLDTQFECPIQDISLTEDNEIMLYLETGEIFTLNIEKQESYRTCDICGRENLLEGYCIEGGKEFFGECWTSLKCFKCNKSINYDWNEDNTKVIIKEEI